MNLTLTFCLFGLRDLSIIVGLLLSGLVSPLAILS